MIGINVRRRESGELWQERFFDRALRTVREDHEKVEYIYLNPVRRGFVKNAEDWK
jgi:putative transposase